MTLKFKKCMFISITNLKNSVEPVNEINQQENSNSQSSEIKPVEVDQKLAEGEVKQENEIAPLSSEPIKPLEEIFEIPDIISNPAPVSTGAIEISEIKPIDDSAPKVKVQSEGAAKDVNLEDVKENKSESEYEDVEDPEYDVFDSDNSVERKRIIQVKYSWGGSGFIKKSNISKKITIHVKTFYGERIKEKFEVDINSEVGSLVEKLANKEEVNSYHIIKFMYPMGRMRSLSLTESFADQGVPNGACLVLIGKKDFCWDYNRKGRNITVSEV